MLRPNGPGWNRSVVEEMRLEEFLFGVDRVSTAPLVPALKDVQENCCFYCHHKITGKPQIDHFLPWSRHPDNGIENLVLSDRTCNANKRDLLASAEFVGAWALRFDEAEEIGQYLATAAVETGWERHPHRTLGAARALYLHLPDGTKLWAGRNKFTDADPAQLQKALAS